MEDAKNIDSSCRCVVEIGNSEVPVQQDADLALFDLTIAITHIRKSPEQLRLLVNGCNYFCSGSAIVGGNVVKNIA